MRTKKSSNSGFKTFRSTMRKCSIALAFAVLLTSKMTGQPIANSPLSWSTYYGGNDFDEVNAVATDRCGNVYVAGRTYSTTGIATAGAHQPCFGGYADAFIAKFNSSGARVWATYYGGCDFDEGFAVATDDDGNVYLTGQSFSTSAIATPGAYQPTYGGNGNAFLVKFNSDGVRQWGTYFGINGSTGKSIATDGRGNVYMTGSTSASGIASPGAHQVTFGGNTDAFLVKFSSSGNRRWATYYGGCGTDLGQGVATDQSGNIYIVGLTNSTSAIASNSALKHTFGGGSYDIYLAKFSSGGTRRWGTYYGGSGDDQGYGVATDVSGNVYITGITTTPGLANSDAYQPTHEGNGYNALLVKFDEHGWRKWATYYGGNGATGSGVATDGYGNVYMTGSTYKASGVATCGAYQTTYGGGLDAYLVKFNYWGGRQWATYFGGSGDDEGRCTATDNSGNVYIGGVTNSTSGIATCPSYQGSMNGVSDGFLAKFGKHHYHDHDGQRVASLGNAPKVEEYSIYPNPNNGSFTVEIPATAVDATVTIVDAGGKTVGTKKVTPSTDTQKIQFDLTVISKGIHFVEVIGGDKHYVTKVLLQ